MTMPDTELDELIAAGPWEADATADPGGHPDDLELAALADGTVSSVARGRLEDHLAGCASCREVLAVVAGHLAEGGAPEKGSRDRGAPGPLPWGKPTATSFSGTGRVLLAAAAALLAVGLLVLRAPQPGAPTDGRPPGFETFVGDLAPPLRAGDSDPLELLGPRFEVLEDPRPVFRFRGVGPGAELVRLLVIDAEERPVGRVEVAADRFRRSGPAAEMVELDYPDDLPPLDTGLYAWKVDVRSGDGTWSSSGFAPFRVVRSEP